MTFALTQFTFDPYNRVNISHELTKTLGRIVSDKIFAINETLAALHPDWTLVYIVSSDKAIDGFHVRKEVKKSRKYKHIDHYVYFPK